MAALPACLTRLRPLRVRGEVMKKNILCITAVFFAAALTGILACTNPAATTGGTGGTGGTGMMSGCGGGTTAATIPALTCGAGTHENAEHLCVPNK